MNQALPKVKSENQETQVYDAVPVLIPKDALDIIETRTKLFDKIMTVALAATGLADWVDQDGKPYLQGSGAEKVARRFGVRIHDISIEREDLNDENGKYYVYTVMGKATMGERDTVEAIGTCSSRDKFFGKKGGQYKAVQDVDLPNIKKKAYTNFEVNSITRLLGLRNLTWAELEKYGIRPGGKTSVRYDGNASAAAATNQARLSSQQAKKPFWQSDYQGKTYLNAREGQHFSCEYLEGLGFRRSQKTEGLWSRISSKEIFKALEQEFDAGEKLAGGAQ